MKRAPHIGLHVAPGAVRAYDLRRRTELGLHATLDAALAPLQGSRARLEVVLSDAHCRHLVVPRPEGIRSRAELEAALHSRVRAVLGETEGWQLRHAAAPWSRHDFVTLADGAVLEAIEHQAAAARLRVASVRPHWVAWARHFAGRTRRGDHWVVACDGSGWASIGCLRNGECRQARALRVDPGTSLGDLLARERAFADGIEAAAPVWIGGVGLDATPSDDLNAQLPGGRVPPGALWGVAEGAA